MPDGIKGARAAVDFQNLEAIKFYDDVVSNPDYSAGRLSEEYAGISTGKKQDPLDDLEKDSSLRARNDTSCDLSSRTNVRDLIKLNRYPIPFFLDKSQGTLIAGRR